MVAQEQIFLSDLQIYNSYSGKDYGGRFKDISGAVWDTSDLYKNKNYAEISGYLSLDYLDGKIVRTINSSFDLGKKSKALDASPLIAFR